MRVLLVLAAVALAAANVVKDDTNVFIGKDNMGEYNDTFYRLCGHQTTLTCSNLG